jgi:hypothetical protein
MARREPADLSALHPDLRQLAEPGGGVARDHRPASHPPRHLRLRQIPNAQIRAFIDSWNVWTKTTEEILKKADRPKTSETRH